MALGLKGMCVRAGVKVLGFREKVSARTRTGAGKQSHLRTNTSLVSLTESMMLL
jgi:hypothetical protein